MSILTTEKEPHGFICKCGGIIHFGDEELTPPVTYVTCGFCGREGQYLGDYCISPQLKEAIEIVHAAFPNMTEEEIKSLLSKVTEKAGYDEERVEHNE